MKNRHCSLSTLALSCVLGLGFAAPALADDHGGMEMEATEAIEAVEMEATEAEIVPTSDIADIVANVPEFSTLATALDAADLTEVLQGEGPLTVIAPVNDAFTALPEGVLDALLLPENKDLLTDVLTYHVIPGEVMYEDFSTGDVATAGGTDLPVVADNDMVLVNDVEIVGFDLPATNGLIHVVESVLVPEAVATELGERLAAAEPMTEETMTEETTEVMETPTPATATPAPATVEEMTPAEPVRGLW